jgi:transcriptional regulator with XRE-family HTH domain
LSLADLAKRTGMDRAAIHKLEIGLNSNPTYATLTRYSQALGARIEWKLKRRIVSEVPQAERGFHEMRVRHFGYNFLN